MLRDDEFFPNGAGTKWRKLKHLTAAKGIATLGGAFSNHLHAVASLGVAYEIPTVGLVRGEYVDEENPTLSFCRNAGMSIRPIKKQEFDQGLRSQVVCGVFDALADYSVLPMGGDSMAARRGAGEIVDDIIAQLPVGQAFQVVLGAGSGSTARGVASRLNPGQYCIGVPAAMMHGLDEGPCASLSELEESSRQPSWLPPPSEPFAEMSSARLLAIEKFFADEGILLDPIYTSRAILSVQHLRPKDDRLSTVIVHTGGLQGWAGMKCKNVSSPLAVAIQKAIAQTLEAVPNETGH